MEDERRQTEAAARVRAVRGAASYRVVTFGCQMNHHDSLRLMGWCDEFGWAADEEDPDILIFNTCCVRDGAERRVHGQVAALAAWKREKPLRFLAVCGCMMQQPGVAEAFRARHPHVDLIMGTHALGRFPELVLRALSAPVIEVSERPGVPEGLPARAEASPIAYVAAMYGCDNRCSYCIVPYVRGRERSRDADAILREIDALVAGGVREVMLLGQNVNAYGREGGGPDFPELLRRISGRGLARIRFMTSHPRDATPRLFAAMAESPEVCAQLHLPVQSGSDGILAAMNRGYTAGRYLDLVEEARRHMPNLGLTTDIIVGFPGESETDFQATLDLVAQARPDGAYTFLYSPRKGTPAYGIPGRIAREEMSRRNARLREAIDGLTRIALLAQLGRRIEVLVESASPRGDGLIFGRTERGFRVGFPGDAALIGTLATVTVEDMKRNTLTGRRDPA